MELIFWGALALLAYSYVGYGVVLYALVKLKRLFFGPPRLPGYPEDSLPEVTLVVAAYNEADYIEKKIQNSLLLSYPRNKLHFLFVTDGSNDATPNLVKQYPQVTLYHQPERQGKIAAVNRVMPYIHTPVTVFSDANTDLNPDAIRLMIRHFADAKTGAVAGEKRVLSPEKDSASGAGEGFYWKYESALKRWDSELYSVVGAAGELFAVRTELYEPVSKDTLIEDFYLTVKMTMHGYRVAYEPDATATETASATVGDEMKRKIRIAAGGLQAIGRLWALLFPFPRPLLTFQYVSHRVLRWTLAPLALPVALVANVLLAWEGASVYQWLLTAHVGFYLAGWIGKILKDREISFKPFFIPYYFLMMNWCVYLGAWRLWKGRQSAVWEKAARRKTTPPI